MQAKTNDLIMFLMQQPPDKEWLLEEYNGDKKPRTMSQNRYYWQLLEKLVVKTHIPKAEKHNLYLRQVAQTKSDYESIDGKPMYILIPDTDEAEKTTLQAETYHIAPTNRVKEGDDGQMYRWYVMLKGSHEFTVNQMAALLDLAVQDAKALGIETLTPAELQHMKELELEHERRKKK